MKLAHSQRRTLLGHGLKRSPSVKKGLRKACVRVQRGWLKKREAKTLTGLSEEVK